MASPQFKVYDGSGNYRGCVKDPTEAAALVSLNGDGSSIRFGHRVKDTLWTEGVDGYAGSSYDECAETCHQRMVEVWGRKFPKPYVPGMLDDAKGGAA